MPREGGFIVVEVAPLLASLVFDIPLWTVSQFAAKKNFHVVLHPFLMSSAPVFFGEFILLDALDKD